MLAADKPPLEEAYLAHISFKPWADYTKADYTPEQWHKACLIHQHQGPPTSKDQCKLPVRTPLGALNKNGVQAAKAALNGARGGVDATPEEKAKAKAQLDVLSKELESKASKVPAFLAKHSGMDYDEALLIHYGIRGMKWGHRKGKAETGISRARGARVDKNDRHIQLLKDMRNSLGKKGVSGGKVANRLNTNVINGLNRMTMGKTLTKKYYDVKIDKMQAHNARLKSGKLLVRDRIGLLMTTTPGSLVVSYRPK
jgi:hypothetical protein